MANIFNPDKVLVKQPLSIQMMSPSTGECFWRLTDIKDPNIALGATSEDKADATGATIAKFYQAKTATITGNTSFMTLSLVAAQFGSEKEIATETKKITSPKRDKITIGSTAGVVNKTITLSHTPTGISGSEVPFIYIEDGNSEVGTYRVAPVASETEFSIDSETKTITLPTIDTLTENMKVIVLYKYETSTAVQVVSNTKDMPKSGEVWVECLFADICDQNIEYYGWMVLAQGQLSPETDIPLNRTGDYAFTIDSLADYCSGDGQLISFVIPQD